METRIPQSKQGVPAYGWLLLAALYLPGWFILWKWIEKVSGLFFFHPGAVPALFLVSDKHAGALVLACVGYIVAVEFVGLRLRSKHAQWLWFGIVLIIQFFQAWWLNEFIHGIDAIGHS